MHFIAGQIHADDAPIPISNRHVDHLARQVVALMPHRRAQQAHPDPGLGLRLVHRLDHQFRHFVQRKVLGVRQRRWIEAQFQITHIVGGGVDHGFIRHALHSFPRRIEPLQQFEFFQKPMEVRLFIGELHVGAQLIDVVAGQIDAVLVRDLGQRLQAQRAFQMPVQIDLGQGVQHPPQFKGRTWH